jgi:cyclohexyl-isocyanide hydratase
LTPFRIGFLLFPNVTQLDLTGPAQVLSRMPGAVVEYVGHDLAPVMSDCRLALVPTRTLADPERYDMIVVPGGGSSRILRSAFHASRVNMCASSMM